MHITASVFINDDESGLHHDYDAWLEKLAPDEPVSQYRHNDTGEDNADAHIKRQIMGREVVVVVTSKGLNAPPVCCVLALTNTRTASDSSFVPWDPSSEYGLICKS